VERVLTERRHYDLHEVLIPDVKAISKWIRKVPAGQSAASRLLQQYLISAQYRRLDNGEPVF